MYGLKHNLTLTRNDDNDAIFRGANNAAGNPLDAGKIVLSKAGIPANTNAYAVIISDRLINFQSDGNKFSVVF